MKECEVCIKNKIDGTPYAGLLQPLQILTQAWQKISMDFIESLSKSEGKDTILVVVDRLTKYIHFIPLTHLYSAQNVARSFLDAVYKLHGMPEGIISNRDKIFTSQVWQDLFRLMGVKLHLSTAYHPQIDGQTERVNRCLEIYLCCLCFQSLHIWLKLLSQTEWWYNTNYHSSLGMTPYQALYGHPPPMYPVVNLNMS